MCLLFLNQPISSTRKEQTNVLVCATFIMKKQPFILEKRCSFLVAYIDIFIDFLFLEKKKLKTCSVDSYKSSIFKKDDKKQSKKLDCPVHQIQKCKKRQNSFTVYSFYIHGKAHTERCLVTKGKLKSDVNITSDLIRVEKYVDNNIQFLSSLMRSDMKNINRKVL